MKGCYNTHVVLVSLIFCSVWLMISSCSVQFEKRRYTRGYYLDVHAQSSENENRKPAENNIRGMKLINHNTESGIEIEEQQSAIRPLTSVRQNEPCDRIYFADGSQAEVKVLDVNEKEVVYRKCNEPNSPVIILNKKHISKIEFSSGARYEEGMEEGQEQNNRQEEVQKSVESTNQSQNQTQKPKQASAKEGFINILALFFAITGLVMLILAFLHSWYWLFGAAIFSALGASLGWFGINKPLKGLAIVALIIGTVCSILSSVLFGFL